MQYGYFDDQKREYVIVDPKTPVKWINYIGTLAFGGFIDQTGGALLCKGDPALNRITRYNTLLPGSEFKATTLYIRKNSVDGPALFSPFFVPCLEPYRQYRCHVGLGYSRFVSSTGGIDTDITVFVPPGESLEVRDIRITNRGPQPLALDVIPLVEYTHFDSLKQLTNADWVPQTMQSKAYLENGLTLLTQYAFMRKETHLNYFTANLPASSFETERRYFLGDHEYGTWAHPLALDDLQLGNHEAQRGDNIAALLIPLGILQPGETRRLVTLTGQESSLPAIRLARDCYCQTAEVDQAFQRLHDLWEKRLSCFQVQSPDSHLDSMLNIHNPRQCHTTLNWSRYLSLYQLGYGARGIGFRDSSQDILGVMPYQPAEARQLLEKLLQVQKRDGRAMHQLNPLTMVASVGDSAEQEDRPHYYSDDALWSVLAVCAYLKESGDFRFLQNELPFYEKDHSEKPLESAAVLDHLLRALDFTWEQRGTHGLPLLGFADWNDTVNLPVGAESCFSACLFGKALQEMMALLDHIGDSRRVQLCNERYAAMKLSFNSCAWDGEWYIAYFDDRGQPLGSRQNDAGQIYAYTQAWSVISGFAEGDRSLHALDSVFHKLNTPWGIKLSTPGFNGYDPQKGGITTYPPGAKENGGIFLYVNPWVILAETLTGNAERAYQYYAQINPAARNHQIEQFEVEPYVYPQNILGDEHPQFGLGRNSWLSGTASWMMTVGSQAILGIQPSYTGLRITPCIPAHWPEFSVHRVFRGTHYNIRVKNPHHISSGVKALNVEGRWIEGNLIPLLDAQSVHEIEVILEN